MAQAGRSIRSVLIIVPPSETKRPPTYDGQPVDIDTLSFPRLNTQRKAIARALIATSASPDALRRLGVRSSKTEEVIRNQVLFDLPAQPVLDVYSGPLHEGLDAGGWSTEMASRAERELVVTSAVWGALRPSDRIPPYRCHICAHLLDMDRLEPTWRAVLPKVLAEAADDDGVVLDLRSPTYQAAGSPTGLAARTVTLRIRGSDRGRNVGDVVAKRVRGAAARVVLGSDATVRDPQDLVAVLAERWTLDVEPPPGSADRWTVTLHVAAEG